MIPGSYVSASGLEVGAGAFSHVSGRKNQSGYFITSLEIIQLGVLIYVRFPLLFRNVRDHMHEGAARAFAQSAALALQSAALFQSVPDYVFEAF